MTAQPHSRVSFLAQPVDTVQGQLRVPGDKSISHRAVMFGALADGPCRITGFLAGADCLATLHAFERMGVRVERDGETALTVHGVGLHGLAAPDGPLDVGNSGTAMRLFAGLLSGQSFATTLIGDASLHARPMGRVATPLAAMGARIETRDGYPPLRIARAAGLTGIDYESPIASAQVKSAILLAGLYAEGVTRVAEPGISRDHTERMLRRFGQPIRQDAQRIELEPVDRLSAADIAVPADLSSAAFFVLAATLARSGQLTLTNVGLNPTRDGVLRILELMGADIEVHITSEQDDAEPAGTLVVRSSRLHGIDVPPELVPLAIDELPLIFIAGALAQGETVIRGAEELRHKESDRIGVMARGLAALGADIEETADGARIRGGTLSGGEIDSAGDHRVAMGFAVASVAASGAIRILDTENVGTSFPGFVAAARSVGLDLTETADA